MVERRFNYKFITFTLLLKENQNQENFFAEEVRKEGMIIHNLIFFLPSLIFNKHFLQL